MSYKLEKRYDESAIVITLLGDFDVNDFQQYFNELSQSLDDEPSPISLIVNSSQYKFGFNDLLSGVKIARDHRNPHTHKNCKRTIVVSGSSLMKASIKGFQTLGISGDIEIADSLEEALVISSSIEE